MGTGTKGQARSIPSGEVLRWHPLNFGGSDVVFVKAMQPGKHQTYVGQVIRLLYLALIEHSRPFKPPERAEL
jgi:hypothetical protein